MMSRPSRSLLVTAVLFLPLIALTCILTGHAWLPSTNLEEQALVAPPISTNQPPEQQGKVRVLLDNTASVESCSLEETRIEFLDCGHDGDVYTAPLLGDCGIARRGEQVAVKFSTSFLNDRRQKRYLGTSRDDGKWLYQCLVTNTTSEAEKQRIMRHFIIPFATASFPRPVLETMKNQSESLCYYQNTEIILGSMDEANDTEQVIQAKVTLFASGRDLTGMLGHMTRDLQHRVIKDLVYIFRRMYHRGLLHNDVSPIHIIVNSNNITSLIDYDRSKIAKDAVGWVPSFDERMRHEQWDLLALIGNVCYNQDHVEFEVPPKPTPSQMDELMTRLGPVLNECGFKNKAAMEWNKELLLSNNTGKTYQSLAEWCGLAQIDA